MSSAVPSRKSSLTSDPIENKSQYAEYLGSAESIQKRIDELTLELKELHGERDRLQSLHAGDNSNKTHDVDLKVLPFQKEILMLTKAMPHMVWLADSEGKCFQANERYYEFTGLTEQEDDGWSWMRVMHPEDLPRITQMGAVASETGEPLVTEFRYLSKEGEYQWHHLYCIPYFDPHTLTTKWFGTTTNIHERKQAIEVLKQSEEHFKILADAIPQIVFAACPDGKVNFWNSRWFEYSGFTNEQAQSDAWQLLIHPSDREKYLGEWHNALLSGDSLECVFRMKRAVGVKQSDASGYRKHLARVVALRDSSGEIAKWFGTWTEIESP